MILTDLCARNLAKAEAARDRGVALTMQRSGGDWFEIAMTELVKFIRERGEATVEQFRFDWLSRGGSAPASHKSWGALAITAARRNLIVNTGRYVKAHAEKTHAHRVATWRTA